MVAKPHPNGSDDYDELSERWPDRPSRKRAKRTYRRQLNRVKIRSERLDVPDASRISRALLQAQRDLKSAQEEKDARAQEDQ